MTEAEALREEKAEIQAEIDRLRGSMNRADNGVKVKRIAVLTRTVARLDKSLAALKKREEAA
jgi:uncharacterized small protein (DUF1192 family)